MMRALVTGGAGFIGSHLVEDLVRDGFAVRVLDDFSSGRRENLRVVAADVEVIEGDAADPGVVREATRGVDVVFHLAAIPSVQRSVERPEETQRANVDAALAVLEAARAERVQRLVLAGSSAVYGDRGEGPKSEEDPVEPLSPYAAQKLAAEALFRCYAHSFGLRTVVLRYFNVYGPRQDPRSPYSGVISLFCAALAQGRPPTIFGDGRQTRDFVFVGDVVRANRAAAERDLPPGAVVNVGGGRPVAIERLFELVRDAAVEAVGDAARLEPLRGPARAGEVRHSRADLSRARRWLGYEPRVTLEEGLRRTLQAMLKEDVT